MDAAVLVDKALGWHSRPISHLGQPCSFLISGYNTWVWLSKWINWTPFGMLCCIEISDILPVLELKTVQLLNWNWMSFQTITSVQWKNWVSPFIYATNICQVSLLGQGSDATSDKTWSHKKEQMSRGVVRVQSRLRVAEAGRAYSMPREEFSKINGSWGYGSGVEKEDSLAKATGSALEHQVWMGDGDRGWWALGVRAQPRHMDVHLIKTCSPNTSVCSEAMDIFWASSNIMRA